MTVATTIVNEALKLAGVASAISTPEPEQQSTAFAVLKDLLNTWTEEGLSLGLSAAVPDAIGDNIAEDSWATGPLKALLAEAILPYFRVDASMGLSRLIEDARNTLLINGAPDQEPYYPGNLPLGQGNASPLHQSFFPEPELDE